MCPFKEAKQRKSISQHSVIDVILSSFLEEKKVAGMLVL